MYQGIKQGTNMIWSKIICLQAVISGTHGCKLSAASIQSFVYCNKSEGLLPMFICLPANPDQNTCHAI